MYVQVKTRESQLNISDISKTLQAFAALRREHGEGRRQGNPSFWIISNVGPGRRLSERIEEFSDDVHLVWPSHSDACPEFFPPPWPNVELALHWLSNEASEVPFTTLSSDTLILKLAAVVQYASSGTRPINNHEFDIADMAGLLEQIVIQVHDLPEPPDPYYPLEYEPDFLTTAVPRLIVGHAGSGKTAWCGQAALNEADAITYFGLAGLSGSQVETSLAREIAAKHFGTGSGKLGEVLLTGAAGLESIMAMSRSLALQGRRLLVFVDDAH